MRATSSNASFEIKTPGQNGRFHLTKGDNIQRLSLSRKNSALYAHFFKYSEMENIQRFSALKRGVVGRAGLLLPVLERKKL